jgi:hypothetical protein
MPASHSPPSHKRFNGMPKGFDTKTVMLIKYYTFLTLLPSLRNIITLITFALRGSPVGLGKPNLRLDSIDYNEVIELTSGGCNGFDVLTKVTL